MVCALFCCFPCDGMALGLNMCNLVVLVLTTVEDCTIHHISTVFKGNVRSNYKK